MKKRLLIAAFILFGTAHLKGQGKIILYYNSDWELTTAEKAVVKREADLDLKEIVFDGQFQDYDKENRLICEGRYEKGVRTGDQKKYFADGTLQSRIEYKNKDFTIWELTGPNRETLMKEGTGKFSIEYIYFENFFEIRKWKEGNLTGEFTDGKRTGKWTYKTKDGNRKDEEIYENGIFVKRTAFTKSGERLFDKQSQVNISPNSKRTDAFDFDLASFSNLNAFFELNPIKNIDSITRNATYPGGMKNLTSLIALNLTFPAEARRNPTPGTVIISLTIDEHGIVKNYNVIKGLSKILDNEALRVMKLLDSKWLPALLEGKAYESTISIPIAFRFG